MVTKNEQDQLRQALGDAIEAYDTYAKNYEAKHNKGESTEGEGDEFDKALEVFISLILALPPKKRLAFCIHLIKGFIQTFGDVAQPEGRLRLLALQSMFFPNIQDERAPRRSSDDYDPVNE